VVAGGVVETQKPIATSAALRYNFTNEGGVGGRFRFLKNVTGFWLLQQLAKSRGRAAEYGALVKEAAEGVPLRTLLDPDAECFRRTNNMGEAMAGHCRRTRQPVPRSRAGAGRSRRTGAQVPTGQRRTGEGHGLEACASSRTASGEGRPACLPQARSDASGSQFPVAGRQFPVSAEPQDACGAGECERQLAVARAGPAAPKRARCAGRVVDETLLLSFGHPASRALTYPTKYGRSAEARQTRRDTRGLDQLGQREGGAEAPPGSVARPRTS